MSAFLLSTITFSNLSAQQGMYPQECQQDCPPQCPCDREAGECYCKYVRYVPKCHYTTRCIEESIPYTRKCCRDVPEYYSVQKCRYRTENYCVPQQRCRYVPEHYCIQVQKCRYVPEYYTVDVPQCRYVPQPYTVQIPKCRQVPEYYCEQKCRTRKEYYDVQECRTCKRYVKEPNYTCVPQYYWKYECRNPCQ